MNSTVVFWEKASKASRDQQRFLPRKHPRKYITDPGSTKELVMHIEQEFLEQGLRLLATRFPNGFDGDAALCR